MADKDKKSRKPSSYNMLKRLDQKVQQSKNRQRDDSRSRAPNNYRRKRSPSPKNQGSNKKPFKRSPEIILDLSYDTPDRSFGDLFCKVCDSHMNSEVMWENHIQGKRHLKNIKKGDVEDPKYKIIDEDPLLLPRIKELTVPVVGLQHCCEFRRLVRKPFYECFLCSANIPTGDQFLEHIVGVKHRMAYLKKHDPVKHDLITGTNLKKSMMEPVVADCIRLHQDKHGIGKMQVKLMTTKFVAAPIIKNFDKPHPKAFDERSSNDERRKDFPDNHCEDYDYRPNYEKRRPRSECSDDSFEDRYRRPLSSERDNYREPPSSYPEERREPPRRSPTAYEQAYREERTPTTMNNQHSIGVPLTRPQLEEPLRPMEDLRTVLEQRKTEEHKSAAAQNSNLFQSLLTVIEALPSALFLELVLQRLEKMNPTESDLSMLTKIGNHMISMVMDRKLQNLTPELYNQFPSAVSKPDPPVQNSASRNLSSLMSLVDQFASRTPVSDAVTWGNMNQQAALTESLSHSSSPNMPAFITQSAWGSSSQEVQIPGLTLSSAEDHQTPSYLSQDSSTSWAGPFNIPNRY